MKSVADIINPSGVRVKPTDTLLKEFGRACESLKTEIIGSILLNNIIYDIPWNSLMVIIRIKKLKKFILEKLICN